MPSSVSSVSAPIPAGGAPDNIAFRKRLTAGDAAVAFERAAYRVGQRMTSQRIAPVAMERGQRFAIREGGRTIGAGRVTEVIA